MASEADLEAASLYRTFRRMGHDPAGALAAARGRDYASPALFEEAVRRGEDAVLAVERVGAMRDDFVAIGISEAQAREQALEYGWELIESRVDDTGTGTQLSEAGHAVADRLGLRGIIEKGKRAKAKTQATAKTPRSWVVKDMREVGDGTVQPKEPTVESMTEDFMRMGLTESQARHAAEGRR